jgi:NAD(P)-dependent dehydrogenase (short-subunit alcohol dehydrogenase family)
MAMLRENLLAGRRIAVGGALSEPVIEALQALGAELEFLSGEQLPSDENRVGEWARGRAPLHALIWDGGGAFDEGGQAGLDGTLEQAWTAVREVATGALIGATVSGKLLLIAPRPDAGPLADAARAGLENLVRTLSVEWARYEVTAVTIAPGVDTTEQQLAELVCFVVSDAGNYLSGCRLELGSVA